MLPRKKYTYLHIILSLLNIWIHGCGFAWKFVFINVLGCCIIHLVSWMLRIHGYAETIDSARYFVIGVSTSSSLYRSVFAFRENIYFCKQKIYSVIWLRTLCGAMVVASMIWSVVGSIHRQIFTKIQARIWSTDPESSIFVFEFQFDNQII